MILPRPYQNVMLTYIGSVKVRDKYYDHYEQQQVTRRAFYADSDGYYDTSDNWITTPNGYFMVPQYWEEWTFSDGTTALLPATFHHYGRVLPENIINWVPDEIKLTDHVLR